MTGPACEHWEAFQKDAFDNYAFQANLDFVTAFQPDAFQNDAFQIVPPAPPLIIKLIPGGGYKKFELIDEESERAIREYLRLLYDESFDEDDVEDDEAPLVPDAILGKDEYKHEKVKHGRERVSPRPIKTAYRFESSLDPISCQRVVLFAEEAKRQGMPLTSADTFSLKYKLGIFKPDYEKMMLEGAMVKVTSSKVSHRLALADLAKRTSTAWWPEPQRSLPVRRNHPRAEDPWYSLAGPRAGAGALFGYDLWKQHRLLKYEDMRKSAGHSREHGRQAQEIGKQETQRPMRSTLEFLEILAAKPASSRRPNCPGHCKMTRSRPGSAGPTSWPRSRKLSLTIPPPDCTTMNGPSRRPSKKLINLQYKHQ